LNFYSVRDLRTHPKQVWKKLSEVQQLVITNNGKPSALLIEINDDNMEEVLASVRQSMAMRATNQLRINSIEMENSQITEEEINAEIAETRKEHKS